MCRIFGVAYNKDAERENLDTGEIAAFLFSALVHGGPHAYGWMQYSPADGVSWEKHQGRADTDEAVEKQLYGCGIYGATDPESRWTGQDETEWFVGHVRYATHGSPMNMRNNHPIPHGNIVGVHNGILRNHDRILSVTGREDKLTQVDSEAIFAAVNKWGPTKGLRRLNGDMVTVFTDLRYPHRLRIARSSGRYLTIGFTKKGNIIFSTEEFPLLRLAPEIQFDHISQIAQNRLLTIRDGKIVQRATYRVVPPKPKTIPVVEMGDKEFNAWLRRSTNQLDQARAQARGEAIFGNRTPNQNRKTPEDDLPVIPLSTDDWEAEFGGPLYERNGQWYTRWEYDHIFGEPAEG